MFGRRKLAITTGADPPEPVRLSSSLPAAAISFCLSGARGVEEAAESQGKAVENERPRAAVSPVGGQAPLARRRRVLAQRPEPAELEPDHPDQLSTTVIIFAASRLGKS